MEVVTWASLLAAAGAVVAVARFAMSLGATQAQVKDTSSTVAMMSAKQELLNSQLSDHKVHVAQNYATSRALTETEASLAQNIQAAVQGVYSRLDGMTERLDRLIGQAKDRN